MSKTKSRKRWPVLKKRKAMVSYSVRTEYETMAISESYQLSIVSGLIEEQLDPEHELLVLARKLDWYAIHKVVKSFYKLLGRKAKDSRLMVGALILKHRFKLSDEQVVAGLNENLYWRVFCGLDGQIGLRRHVSVLDRRLQADGLRKIEACIRKQLVDDGVIDPTSMYIDTTAQEKNVAYPVDTHLLNKGQERLRKQIRKLNSLGLKIKVRNFSRKAKRAVLLAAKLGGNRKERIQSANKELIEINREVQKSVKEALRAKNPKLNRRKQEKIQKVKDELRRLNGLVNRVIHQTKERMKDVHVPNKVLSLHEPEVAAIPKGKRSKPNEYGSKVALSTDNNGFVVTHQEYNHNIFDVKTLETAVDQWEEACGQAPEELAADRGFHTDELPNNVQAIPEVAIPTKGNKKHKNHKTEKFKRLQRKRAAQEPIISHLKHDHLMNRCRYKGFEGDQINVSLAVIAWNTKKWIRLDLARQEKRRQGSTMSNTA
jgi:IS5 family transposase